MLISIVKSDVFFIMLTSFPTSFSNDNFPFPNLHRERTLNNLRPGELHYHHCSLSYGVTS